MTPQKRLDQLEPLFAKILAKEDEISAELERVSAQVRQLILTTVEAATTQSDNIQFLLREQAEIKSDLSQLKAEMSQLKAEMVDLNVKITRIETEIAQLRAEINGRLNRIEDMVVAIYQAIQKPSGN